MRPLAFSSNAFKKNTLIEAIDALADIGYRGVELMADLHHAWPPDFSPQRRAETKKQLAARGMAVSNVNAFTCFVHGDTYHPTFITDDPERLKIRVDHTKAAIELAAEFACRTVSVQPGGPLIGTGLSREEAERRFAEALQDCVPTARACGVTIAVEPEPGLLIQTGEEYLQFKQMYFADEPGVRMNCDIGHLFCVGDDPAAVIRAMPEDVAHVHIEDIGENHVHQHLTPGQGVIDFDAIFAALDDIDYGGWVTVELYPFVTTAAGTAKAAWDALVPSPGTPGEG